MRLAASVAQGLAFGAQVGVVPVSNLAAVAQRVVQLTPSIRGVLVANDARMKEVYWAWYEVDGALVPGPEAVSAPGEVQMPVSASPWAAAGRGLRAWPALAERCRAAGAVLHVDLLPRASEVLVLARLAAAAGQILDPADALPVYVRDRVTQTAL